MATAEDTHVTEYIRDRETARYDELLRARCLPIGQRNGTNLSASPDNILTSFAQLATCRTMTERSMISLFDETEQYVVAEATPTTSLLPTPRPDNSRDAFWLCGSYIPRNDGICDYMLRAADRSCTSSTPDELPVFVVQDLVTDPRFSSSPYCQAGSSARFYASVPIRSPRGINIGSLCVFHSTPGVEWTDEYADVLRGLSQTIMDHLEGNRIKNTLKRSRQIGIGLQKFTDRTPVPLESNLDSFASIKSAKSHPPDQKQADQDLQGSTTPNQEPISSVKATPLEILQNQPQRFTSLNTFFDAATIIRESLDVDGCAFYGGDSCNLNHVRSSESDRQSEASLDRSCFSPTVISDEDDTNTQLQLPCQVLGSSFTQLSDSASESVGGLSQPFLSHLLEQYPQGSIFNLESRPTGKFDNPNNVTLDEQSASAAAKLDEISLNEDHPWPRLSSINDCEITGSIYEQKELSQAFPDARSVAFIPIWDPQKGMWSIGGFACSRKLRYEFDRDSELPFLRALGILAASEAFRLDTSKANKSKSDVLGSISHELRSPLHGIMLGLELLSDSGLTAAQRNLAYMIETCCRTLLDTTEHLLNYSKVNQASETDKHQAKAVEQSNNDKAISVRAEPTLRSVPLNLIIEDVIESVYAGHSYQQISIAGLFSPPKHRKDSGVQATRRLESAQAAEEASNISGSDGQHQHDRHVSVFLLYDPMCPWNFRTIPGAIRRIIMNLFGNSLKYTSRGVIKVSVSQSQPENAKSNERIVTLVVEDTGRGIGEEFLRNKIFRPFSQEDQLSTGTGLGLSFVHRITSQLGGTISITSQVAVGTKVTVSLPMMLDVTSSTHERGIEEQACYGLRAAVTGSIQSSRVAPPRIISTDSLIERLCCDHLGMTLVTDSEAEELKPDVIIFVNHGDSSLPTPNATWEEMPVLVVCNDALLVQKSESACKPRGHSQIHEFITQPLSPKKVEEAMSRLMNLWAESRASPPTLIPMPLPTISTTTGSSQPPTPSPLVQESPLGGLLPTLDYFQTPQFLLVEDNPINLKMLTCFMKKLNQPYRTAVNGEEAVLSYKESPGQFRYILMDISMPVMDGLEATRQIRAFEQYHDIPPSLVMAITGLGSESTRNEATRSGVDLFVTKPVKLKELEGTLKARGLYV
ncbi:uncharacterized protein B0J16DRAFT_331757 [Fusarium flagelliforme]|uniref:uncharacterized protein n=1 Tax=Fusarium flagelliforme TaxID=2675880 RepID=UPI001E8E24C7|nr:uncharacterized protein B0J16DRAFT_331757 [Fusarium flagelliforme]KAH7191780.1 hypothetical protein B0J16DRAFT_331757 [Fusarium flagelliforme]